MRTWELADAKDELGRVVEGVLREGPQAITRRGEPVAVVVSIETWWRLIGGGPHLEEWLRFAPIEGLDLERGGADRPDVDLP